MSEIKHILQCERINSYVTISRETLPIRYNFEGKEWEVTFTQKGGLIMTGVREKEKQNGNNT